MKMNNTFFTSDTHFHHRNIVRGTTSWLGDPSKGAASVQRTRNFDTLEEHDQTLVDNINKCAKENDTIYFLGDFSFGGIDQIWNFRKQLNCKNIHLIFGNHDQHIGSNKQIVVDPERFCEISGYQPDPYKKYQGKSYVNVSEIFASTRYYLHSHICGQDMVLCHFAFRVWDKSHHGTWNLYGHSHGTLEDYEIEQSRPITIGSFPPIEGRKIWSAKVKSMDVGVDTHPEFRPYHFDEIAKIMKDRVNLVVDHHNNQTS